MKAILLLFLLFPVTQLLAQETSPQDLYQQSITEFEAKRFAAAEKLIHEAVNKEPGNAQFQLQLAEAMLAQRKYRPALVVLKEAEKLSPNNPEIITQLATLSMNLRLWNEVIKYAQKQKELDASISTAYMLGKAWYELEDYGKAVTYLNQALKESPTLADAFYYLNRSYMEMSNYRLAAQSLEKAIALNPDNAAWIYELGLLNYAIPDDKKALEYFELAAEKGYKRSNDYIENLANVYFNLEQFEKGVALYKEMLERRPGDKVLWSQLGHAYYRWKKYQEAIDSWDHILEIDAGNARALYMIGMAYQQKGEKAKGNQLCDKAIEMDPSLSTLKQEKKMPTGL